jgi:flagellar hook-associated protein 1 FlgK
MTTLWKNVSIGQVFSCRPGVPGRRTRVPPRHFVAGVTGALLVNGALLMALAIGLPLGLLAGLKPNTALDVTVMTGSRALVMSSASYALNTTKSTQNGITISAVVFEVDGRPLEAASGALAGIVQSRDDIVVDMIEELDTLAAGLIDTFNKVHVEGMGLARYRALTSVEGVTSASDTLNQAGLDFTPTNGAFELKVVNETTGVVSAFNISVDLDGIGADATLQDIVDEINAEAGAAFPEITASINSRNQLVLSSSNDNIRFGSGTDSSGLLAALGVNTFFTGASASNIAVNPLMSADPQYVAGAMSIDAGDNSNFQRLLAVRANELTGLQGLTLEGFFNRSVAELATSSSTTSGASESAGVYLESLEADREGVSGVNLDEEAVNLIRYQGVYAASANYLKTVKDLIDILLNI